MREHAFNQAANDDLSDLPNLSSLNDNDDEFAETDSPSPLIKKPHGWRIRHRHTPRQNRHRRV